MSSSARTSSPSRTASKFSTQSKVTGISTYYPLVPSWTLSTSRQIARITFLVRSSERSAMVHTDAEHLEGSGTHEAARRLRDLFESKLRQVVELGHVVERVDPSSSQETLEAAEPNFAKRKRSEDGDVQRKGKRSAREKAMEAAVISGVLRA